MSKNINESVVFIPVTDMDLYSDWDSAFGFGGDDQIHNDDGIVVSKEREDEFKSHISDYEKYRTRS